MSGRHPIVKVMAAASSRPITSRIFPSFFISHPKKRFSQRKTSMGPRGSVLLLAIVFLGRDSRRFLRVLGLLRLGWSGSLRCFRFAFGFGWNCGSNGSSDLAFSLLLARDRRGSKRGCSGSSSGRFGGGSLGCPTPLERRRWWRRRGWRRQRLQELQGLGPRTELPVEQEHENVMRNLGILGYLRRDVQLGHFEQRDFLLHLPPLGKEVLYLLRYRLLTRGQRQEQDHLRARLGKQFPRAGGRGGFLTDQALCQLLRVVLKIPPGLDQIFSRNLFAHVGDVLVAEPGGQKIHDRRRWIGSVSQLIHLLASLEQLAELRRVHLSAGPMRIQYLEPAFLLQHAHNVQWIFFVGQLLDFVPDGLVGDVLDVIIFLGGVQAGLGAFLQRPVKARREASGPDQPGGIFDKSVVMQNAEKLGLDVGGAVERIHQQAARA